MKMSLLAAALAGLALPLAAQAAPPWAGGQGGGNPHGVPPGLAKKPYGLPPGQAKKLWATGEQLPAPYVADERYRVHDLARYRLPPAPYGYRWVRVDDQFYLAQTRTGLIAQVVAALVR